MLGCVTVFGLILGGVLGCGLGLGLLLHWLVPAMDLGVATLSGLVATGVALLTFGQLLTFAEPSEAEELPPVDATGRSVVVHDAPHLNCYRAFHDGVV